MTEAVFPSTGAATRPRLAIGLHVLMILSGVAGLGYQIVWTRMLAIGLGHEVYAVLAVVAAFFAGLALGALALDGAIARSRRPGLWYAGLEALIGGWSLALIWLAPRANGWIAEAMGPAPDEATRWGVAFLGAFLLLAPATLAMGATLPAAERVYARQRQSARAIGGLYAANAAGAMIGALGTAAVIAPALGFSATLALFAALNLFCAGAMLIGPARGEAARPALPAAIAGRGPSLGILAALFFTGLIGIGFEVAAVRALSQILENTVYSFAAALAVYLLGTCFGAALYQALYAEKRGPGWDAPALGPLAAATAAAAMLGTLGVYGVEASYNALRALFGGGLAGSIAAELGAAALVFALPSAAMGALFAHLAQAARGPKGGLGAAFAVNTLGAACAPLLVGVIGAPMLGVMASLAALSLGYLALLALARPLGRAAAGLGLGALGLAVFSLAGPVDPRLVAAPADGRVHAHLEGVAATATVVEDRFGDRWLRVNGGFTMGGTATYALDRIQGHMALLRKARPERALFLGVGTGATLAAAADHPRLRAEGVELLPEVLALIPEFEAAHADLQAATLRMSLHAADARRYVRAADGQYDVIIADNFHPAKDGAGLLYTVEHFQAIRERLSDDGVAVQWLPLHQLDLASFTLIARSFQAVFPDAQLHMGNANLATPILALTAAKHGRRPDIAALAADRPGPELTAELRRIGLDSPFATFGGFIAGPEALAAYLGDGPLNTDDHPRVLFEAPRTVYDGLGPASARLLALVDAFERRGDEAVDAARVPGGDRFLTRLEAYWRARDAFLRLGAAQQDQPQSPAELGLALLEIVKISPDYTPALAPAMRIARSLAPKNPPYAIQLARALDAAAPGRAAVKQLRRGLERRDLTALPGLTTPGLTAPSMTTPRVTQPAE